MTKVTKQMALEYHEYPRPGKIEVVPTKPHSSQLDLSLAYSPGVAYPCLEIEKNPADAYKYTDKSNLIGVISNGTAVLGLGDIGARAAKPVMEGKALLFKIFAGLDAFDIEVDEKDPDKFIEIVKGISHTFGGINLEDIKAPECFEIERRLREECNIPVMHDDQHGTAIISAAALLNALELQDKKIDDIRLVVSGAGAAAVSCTRLYIALGVRRENIVMTDSKGVIRADRPGLSVEKREFATHRDLHTLADAMKGADVFLGLSKAGVLTPEMLKSMAPRPIVFALANPDPEIDYDSAMASRDDLIFATGRSDYPNQVNNVLGFPYIFRGALDCQASCINEEMKIAAVHAIADLAREPVPAVVDLAYGSENMRFGRNYILPKPLDPRLLTAVAPAVAVAAEKSGVAAKPIGDVDKYIEHLEMLMGKDTRMMRQITEVARKAPGKRKVVICRGELDNFIRAAARLATDGICTPVLLGDEQTIRRKAAAHNLELSGIEILDLHSPDTLSLRTRFAEMLFKRLGRDGVTRQDAMSKMYSPAYFGMMMVSAGCADAFIGGTDNSARRLARIARRVVGIRQGFSHFGTMHILNSRRGTYFLADTTINPTPDKSCLVDIVRLAAETVCFFSRRPEIAMLSYSTFGSDARKAPKTAADSDAGVVREAVKELHLIYPDIDVDGEMQPNIALDTRLRDEQYPFNKLADRRVNTLIFPDLNSANITYRMMLEMGVGEVIGPIQMGLNAPIHFISSHATERDIVNLATIAVIDSLHRQDHRC